MIINRRHNLAEAKVIKKVRWINPVGCIGLCFRRAASVTTLAVLLSSLAWAERTPLKPGWNLFSVEQDIEAGQQVSKDAEHQLPMLDNSRVDNYLNSLGRRLASKAPGEKYPYRFKAVNDRAINAFALPGGPIYVNRGVIEAADNEAQLAGVMAHEIAHVALRHGTNQASKAYAAQVPLSILGGIVGGNSVGAMLAQLGAGFAVNSILLKYSRTAESQADIMATQILYDSGYDPRAMAQFFEKIQAQDRGGRSVEFFSNHPNPENRIQRVNEEVSKLGGTQRSYSADTREFEDAKRNVQSLAASAPPRAESSDAGRRPEWPSDRLARFENSLLRMNHPDNWQAYEQGDAVSIAPRGGLVADSNGNQALAYGVIVNIYEPHRDRYGQQLQGPGYGQDSWMFLEQATDRLVEEFRQSNRNMRVVRSHEKIEVHGERALSTYLSNDSPVGGRETNWLITMEHSDGLLFLVFTAPDHDLRDYEGVFRQMLYSVQIKK